MKRLRESVFAVVAFTALGLSALRAADAPRPLYNNSKPAKQSPASFTSLGSVIDLRDVPPATNVDDANSRLDARAAAAVLSWSISNRGMLALNRGGFKNEMDFALAILCMFSHADYFNDTLDGVQSGKGGFYRRVVNARIRKESPGTTGSSIDRDGVGPLLPNGIHIHAEYDELLTAYVTLYYKYYDALDPDVRELIFSTLLSERGQYNEDEQFSFKVSTPVGKALTIPETENHRLMTQAAKYLTNQLYYQKSVSEGSPDHHNFDNNRNGEGHNPPMVDVILEMLHACLTRDFIEYNARPYQSYTMTALLNLASYAYDDRVKLAARMVLDYISAKVAVSSINLRRSSPFRRRNEDEHWGPAISGGFLGSLLVFQKPNASPNKDPYGPDPQTAFFSMLTGNTGILFSEADPLPGGAPKGFAPDSFTWGMVHAALSDYRVPPSIHDLFFSGSPNRRFYQAFRHSSFELYASSPSYLISAGGIPTDYAYRASAFSGLAHIKGDEADLGVALPTTFIPDSTSAGASGNAITLDHMIQFGKVGTGADSGIVHLCVAPDFACGGPIHVPDEFERDPKRDGNWTFVNRGSDGAKPGYYLAIFRVRNAQGEDWGFLEAYDTWLNGGLSRFNFLEFQQAVKRANPSMQLQFGEGQVNTYITQSGQHIQFKLNKNSSIVSTTADHGLATVPFSFAHGDIVESEGSPGVGSVIGSGLIHISNPTLGTQITLDMHDFGAPGDEHFGVHHPCRTSETGVVECAGGNQEVWVNFDYKAAPGHPQTGDFGDPFTTLAAATKAVAAGGIINIIPGSTAERIVFDHPVTVKSFPGAATIGRQ
jgi:hypothetical protein